jgi:S1-C subfamily serine protease
MIPLLGIEVKNGAEKLKDGRLASGVEILTAIPGSPGTADGLRGRRQGVRIALTIGLLAGSAFFPPAMLGMIALQQSEIGESREVIIAVDGQRTRDVSDFGEVMGKAEAGESVYLTVVSGGQRRQVAVELPGPDQ